MRNLVVCSSWIDCPYPFQMLVAVNRHHAVRHYRFLTRNVRERIVGMRFGRERGRQCPKEEIMRNHVDSSSSAEGRNYGQSRSRRPLARIMGGGGGPWLPPYSCWPPVRLMRNLP